MTCHHVAGRTGLLEILSWARPHDSTIERAFCREYLDRVPGMTADAFGNRILTIGDRPRVMWSCHVDTVAARGGQQVVGIDELGIAGLCNGKAGMSLGADDGAGIWIMLNMIATGRPGLYLFHRGEEQGCLGSRWIQRNTPDLLQGIEAAIAFDRAGLGDVITHQSYGRTCSDTFAFSLANALNGLNPGFRYRPDDTGVYTDTNEYAGIVSECTNLSVGYHGQHGPRETLDVDHCEKLLAAMLELNASQLVIERDPSIQEDVRWGWHESYRQHPGDFADAVAENPQLAVRMLEECGVTLDDFRIIAWEAEMEDDPGYRPLMVS
ncbi:putative aminopeptidase FrvX [Sphingobium xenophagum]|uniref:Aminopeptidase FrvX n=1 Tax=Sphingobium xenophagum TaxID=121428 RepID=A0ABU1X5N1_SPHXE|nr:M28 family peptidase [Sphingobium xenophagum]MDR7156779.1 putative aminopeptidase FrvX [Sphingobium xenophagum]